MSVNPTKEFIQFVTYEERRQNDQMFGHVFSRHQPIVKKWNTTTSWIMYVANQ